jgi:hypothetical protein
MEGITANLRTECTVIGGPLWRSCHENGLLVAAINLRAPVSSMRRQCLQFTPLENARNAHAGYFCFAAPRWRLLSRSYLALRALLRCASSTCLRALSMASAGTSGPASPIRPSSATGFPGPGITGAFAFSAMLPATAGATGLWSAPRDGPGNGMHRPAASGFCPTGHGVPQARRW